MNGAPNPAADNARLSIACALGGSLAFSINDITVKSFSGTLPLHEVVLFRAVVALIVTVAVFAPDRSLSGVFRTRRLSSHMFRGFCVVVSNMAYFAALAALPLAETSAIFFIAPLLITALSAILLIAMASAASHEFRPKEAVISGILLAALAVGVFVIGLKLQIGIWPGAR